MTVEDIMNDAIAGAAYVDDPSRFTRLGDDHFEQMIKSAAVEAATSGRAVEIAPGVTVRITNTSPPLIDVCTAPGVNLAEIARRFRFPPNRKARRSEEKRRAM